jgi:quercetin dioxygenase-like cupin family protein
LIHIPSNARHSFRARDDIEYLYVKDRTSNLFGTAADEGAITEGLGDCYYPLADGLDAPPASALVQRWTEGVHLAFGLMESPQGHRIEKDASPHEIFGYVISGALEADVGGTKKLATAGDVIHVPRGAAYEWTAAQPSTRYALVRSTQRLEAAIAKHGATDNWRG